MLDARYSTVKKSKKSQLTASVTGIMQISAGMLSVTSVCLCGGEVTGRGGGRGCPE